MGEWRKYNDKRNLARREKRARENPGLSERREYFLWRKSHPEEAKKLDRERSNQRNLEYCLRHPERVKDNRTKSRIKNLEGKNPEEVRKSKCVSSMRWYYNNPEKIKINRKKNQPKRSAREKEKYNTDPVFRMTKNLRLRIRVALKGYKKSAATEALTGCPFSYLRLWLQAQFCLGMTWENYGEWQIDHIRPCASFELSDPVEQKRCFHYTNLQPLWATDNLLKGAKWSGTPK